LFSRLLGARRDAVAAAVGITFYTLLVGANPSVVRAAIMGCLGLRTDQSGWIEVSTDGEKMWVEVEKK
jgi:hypothetical protein